MARTIPRYIAQKGLDSGAQTIPRYQDNAQVGEGLKKAGDALIVAGARWQRLNEQQENFKAQNEFARFKSQIQLGWYQDSQNWDPGRDPPGTLHDNMMRRVDGATQQFMASIPPRLQERYRESVSTFRQTSSDSAARFELTESRKYYTGQLDKIVGGLADTVKQRPEMFEQAVKEMTQSVDSAVSLPTAQRKSMAGAYLKTLMEAGVTGFNSQGRFDEAKTFIEKYTKELRPESENGAAPPSGGTGLSNSTGPQSQLNQRRIDQINAKPEIAAAIERAAKEEGFDPNVAKVVASIESGGRPGVQTGSYIGLFQLSRSGFGTFGKGGDITDPYANAVAGIRSLKADAAAFEQKMGRPPTASELYMSHQQGQGGVIEHLKNPDQPAWVSMFNTAEGQRKGEAWAKRAIWGNIPDDLKQQAGSVENVKSSDLMAIYDSKVRGTSLASAYENVRRPVAPPPQEVTMVADSSGRITGQQGATIETAQQDQPTQVAEARKPRTEWDAFSDRMLSQIEGARLKADAKDKAITRELQATIKDDILSIQRTGQEIKSLSPEDIERRLGPEVRDNWERQRSQAHRFFALTSDMDKISSSEILDRLDQTAPVPGSRGYSEQEKLHNDAAKYAGEILQQRAKDPAQAVSNMPEVRAAAEKLDPRDPKSVLALADARMRAQEQLGIAEEYRSPLTTDEARAYARRLTDPMVTNKPDAARQLIENVRSFYGEKYAQPALSAILRAQGVDRATSEQVAQIYNNVTKASGLRGPTATEQEAAAAAASAARARQVFPEADAVTGPNGEPIDIYRPNTLSTPTWGEFSKQMPFEPGKTRIDEGDARILLEDPTRRGEFDKLYGVGAADWALSRGQSNYTPPGADSGIPSAPVETYEPLPGDFSTGDTPSADWPEP